MMAKIGFSIIENPKVWVSYSKSCKASPEQLVKLGCTLVHTSVLLNTVAIHMVLAVMSFQATAKLFTKDIESRTTR